MLGAIIGDIVGSVYEFEGHKGKDFPFFHEEAEFTDDSILTLAIARAILDCKGDMSLLRSRTVTRLKEYTKRYPYPMGAYGSLFWRWVYESPSDEPYGSCGNGAAMRVSPVAYVARSLDEVRQLAHIVTGVTHNHPEGLKGGEAQAVCVYLALQGVTKDELEATMRSYYTWDFNVDDLIATYDFDGTCQGTMPQAFQCFLESTDFEDALRNAIAIGGDADTLGAIVGAIAGAYYGIPEELRKKGLSYLDPRLSIDVLHFDRMYGLQSIT